MVLGYHLSKHLSFMRVEFASASTSVKHTTHKHFSQNQHNQVTKRRTKKTLQPKAKFQTLINTKIFPGT
jgi:hypothetical protein